MAVKKAHLLYLQKILNRGLLLLLLQRVLGHYEVGTVVCVGSRQSAGLQRRGGEGRREKWGGNKHTQFVKLYSLETLKKVYNPQTEQDMEMKLRSINFSC